MFTSTRQCLLRTDPPDSDFPFSTGGSGFIAHIYGRTCFFTARHIFSDENGEIDFDRLKRIVVVRQWGDIKGKNLGFENVYFPRIGESRGTDQVLNDMLLLVCHRDVLNETENGIFVIDENSRAETEIPNSRDAIAICGYPNLPGSTPIDYDAKVYRPNYVVAVGTFESYTEDGHMGMGRITHAEDRDGHPFPFDSPPDGMSGSLVLAKSSVDQYVWAGMMVQSGNGIVRFILAHRMMAFAHEIVTQERLAGRW